MEKLNTNATAIFNIPKDVLDSYPKEKFYDDIREMNGTEVPIQVLYLKMIELDKPNNMVNFQTTSGEPASMRREYLKNIKKSEYLIKIDKELEDFEENKRED